MKIICTQETIQSLELKEVTGHFNNDYQGRLTIGKAFIAMELREEDALSTYFKHAKEMKQELYRKAPAL